MSDLISSLVKDPLLKPDLRKNDSLTSMQTKNIRNLKSMKDEHLNNSYELQMLHVLKIKKNLIFFFSRYI